MSESESTRERLRQAAEAAGRAPSGISAASTVGGAHRLPGERPSWRHRLGHRVAVVTTRIGATRYRLVHDPAWSARRLASMAFVAVVVVGTVAALVASRPSHRASDDQSTLTTTSAALPTTSSTFFPTTSSTVLPTTTAVAAASTTTTPSLPPTTTTTTLPGVVGYQLTTASNTATCVDNGSGGPNCGSGLTAAATASCPAGDEVLGGGGAVSLTSDGGPVPDGASVQESAPEPDGSGWTVVGGWVYSGGPASSYTIDVKTTAVCAVVSSG
jgi:hypothetical protein